MKSNEFPLLLTISNFGTLRYAQMKVGALTLVCGKNNMGKTYATYAFFGFLDYWHRGFDWRDAEKYVEVLVQKHQLVIPFSELLAVVPLMLEVAAREYSRPEILAEVFGAERDFFKDAMFSMSIPESALSQLPQFVDNRSGSYGGKACRVCWETVGESLRLSLSDDYSQDSVRKGLLYKWIGECIKDAVLGAILPRARISCAERTGAVIFQKELDFTRNRLVEMIGDQEARHISPMLFLRNFSARYPLPIRRNVDTARDIPEESTSYLCDNNDPKCQELLKLFCQIIGGQYKVVKGEIRFIPDEGRQMKLDMVLSSSSVRALMHLGVYLLFQAKPGDILMIDEPEQNLHPENQRKMARLLARLVNLGVRVFITTHSDYIVREFNTLIMLNDSTPSVRAVREQYGYGDDDVLDSAKVGVFFAEKKSVLVPGNKIKALVHTLSAANIDPKLGIDAHTFDDTINEMNQIQQDLYFAEEGSND